VKAAEYDQFVRRTDQYAARPSSERRAIALYGLVGEIGSLISAVKKKVLAEAGRSDWDQPNEEIKEELGDVLWYCYSLAQIMNTEPFDILASDISLLKAEIGASNERAESIRAALDPTHRGAFLAAADKFPAGGECSFDQYQILAFNTARTDGHVLLEVCLAVIPQLGAELLRATLPAVERTLNKNIADRPVNTVLGEITWHLAAIASLYNLSLDAVADANRNKVSFRSERGKPTDLPDDGRKPNEQFPRTFDVAFVPVARGKSRMYFEGRRLGNDLTDNADGDDGYRFHDVIHLAFIAHLGWSPVFRGFMKRKRPDIDEIQDGGRAKVVEELVIKAIHSEGERQAAEPGRCSVEGPNRIFPDRNTVPFRLLKTIRTWVEGLEVSQSKFWEWADAICAGCDVFFKLRTHRQGTVHVDLVKRSLTFEPRVAPGVLGLSVGVGMGVALASNNDGDGLLSEPELAWARSNGRVAETVAAKKATLEALGLTTATNAWSHMQLHLLSDGKVSVMGEAEVQQRIWALHVVDYQAAFATMSGHVVSTVCAIAERTDLDG